MEDPYILGISKGLEDFKRSNKVEGLAFALFTDSSIIFHESLGKSTYGHPIDQETLFSIQSISKNVTALTVMMAMQDSLLDLTTPISNYLPEFTVNSCFEENPQNKITVEHLLSHRAGFTHEAPVGNNYDYQLVESDDHIESISQTWLKFPVGNQYSYSNLGYDLTTRIISRQSNISFENYISKRVFQPLGMKLSTLEGEGFLSNKNKTEGTIPYIKVSHYPIPLIGSGAVYTNLSDMINYSQFHINLGAVNGKQILPKESLLEMYKIRSQNYGLGTYVSRMEGIHFVSHSGGGYGYTSTMILFPEYKLGAVLLCNGNTQPEEFCFEVLQAHIDKMDIQKDTVITALFDQNNIVYYENPRSLDHWERYSCDGKVTYQQNWDEYVGTYAIIYPGYKPKWTTDVAIKLGYRPQKLKVYKEDTNLKLQGWFGETLLREYQKGFFLTEDGEVLDLGKEIPTYRNIKLEKR